jgi:phosphate transport system ATP-binding protein
VAEQTDKEQAGMISPDGVADQKVTNPDPPLPQPQVRAAAEDRERPKKRGGHSVSVKGLNAYYGGSRTIKDMTIEFPAREVTAIIGPSGSGKSTVVRCINRMHEEIPGARAEGQIELDGTDVYDRRVDVTHVRRLIGMVFQKPNPFPTMSIFDNVASGLKLAGMHKRDLRDRVNQSLRSVGLWEEVHDRLGTPGMALSGGQQQRMCIARAVALNPEVILMDEPASALDPIATSKIEDLIGQLTDHFTVVIVTHSMQQAARISDYTAFFHLGEIVEVGPTSQIFTHPKEKRTEDYITGRFG